MSLLEFLYKATPTVKQVLGEFSANLTTVGKSGRADFFEVQLDRKGQVKLVKSYDQLGLDGSTKVCYRPDPHTSLFFSGHSLVTGDGKPAVAKKKETYAYRCLRSCIKVESRIAAHLPESSAISEMMRRVKTALADEESFCQAVFRKCADQRIEIKENTGFFFNGDDIDVFSTDSLSELDKAISQAKMAVFDKGVDIFGDVGPINREPVAAVRVDGLGNVKIYGRNDDSRSDQVYGARSVNCCPLTVANVTALNSTFVGLTNSKISGNTKVVSWIDGTRRLVLACPTGFKRATENAIQQTGAVCHYVIAEPPPPKTKPKVKNKGKVKNKEKVDDRRDVLISLSEFRHKSDQLSSAIRGLSLPNLSQTSFEIGIYHKSSSSSSFYVSDLEMSVPPEVLAEQIADWGRLVEQAGKLSFFRKTWEPVSLYPSEVVEIVNCKWDRRVGLERKKGRLQVSFDLLRVYAGRTDATERTPKIITLGDILSLFLRNDQAVVDCIFKAISRYHVHLLRDFANRFVRRRYDPKCESKLIGRRTDVLRLPWLIGLCYGKSGGNMDSIGDEVSFLLGRLCRIMSDAQAKYLTRNGDKSDVILPASFVGDDLLGQFLSGHKPSDVAVRLVNRARPYMNYLYRLNPKKPDVLWFTYRRLLTKITSSGGVPEKFDAKSLCLLGLGYAYIPEKKENGKNATEPTTESEEHCVA